MDCYIRPIGHLWTRGQPYHRVALERFLEEEARQSGVVYRISVPRTEGGHFVGWFRRINRIVCQYRNEQGCPIDIMIPVSTYESVQE